MGSFGREAFSSEWSWWASKRAEVGESRALEGGKMPHRLCAYDSMSEEVSCSLRTMTEKLPRESTRSARALRSSALSRVAQE